MPNHVTHRVVATGPADDVSAFIARCFSTDDEGHQRVDFQRVIPRPTDLDIQSGLSDKLIYAVFFGPDNHTGGMFGAGHDLCLSYWLSMPWLQASNREEAQAWVRANQPEAEAAGSTAKSNMDRYGFADWYGWSVEKWGTKWNAYKFAVIDSKQGRIEFVFDTAWSPPRPVFAVWAALFPSVRFDVDSYDEGGNFACTGVLGVDYRNIPCTPEAYRKTYGRHPTEYDNDGNEVVEAVSDDGGGRVP